MHAEPNIAASFTASQGQLPGQSTLHQIAEELESKGHMQPGWPEDCTRLCLAPVQDRQAVTWCDLQARCLLFESTIHFNASAAHLSFKSRSKKIDSKIAFVSALRASALQHKPCSGWNHSINHLS